jgi:hypothetical protein
MAAVGLTMKMSPVCRINILDKILATEGYFNRFCSCGIEKGKHDIRLDIRQ